MKSVLVMSPSGTLCPMEDYEWDCR